MTSIGLPASSRISVVHVLQLLERRPVGVARPPVGVRVQPDRERLGEVLVGMALRVPAVEMQHEALAVRLRRVVVGILHVGRAEHLLPPPPLPQLVGVVDGVPGLVAQDLHAPLGRAAFDLEHLRPLELLEPGMRQVERDRDARDAVGREPLRRQPEMRLEPAQPARVELASAAAAMRASSALPSIVTLELADPQIQQLVVRPGGPFSGRITRVGSARECSEFAGRLSRGSMLAQPSLSTERRLAPVRMLWYILSG